MPPLTPTYAYPYPSPTDDARGGATAIRLLAEKVEAAQSHLSHAAQFGMGDPGVAVGGSMTPIPFTGAASLAGFSYGGANLTYDGPGERMFIVSASLVLEYNPAVPGGTTLVSSSAQLVVAGTVVDGSDDRLYVDVDGAGTPLQIRARTTTHRISCPMILTPGQVVQLQATMTPGGQAVGSQLRAYPVGPTLA